MYQRRIFCIIETFIPIVEICEVGVWAIFSTWPSDIQIMMYLKCHDQVVFSLLFEVEDEILHKVDYFITHRTNIKMNKKVCSCII